MSWSDGDAGGVWAARRRSVWLSCAVICALLMLGGGATAAQAATCDATWTGASSDLWGDPGNWSGGVVPGGPGSSPNVCLPAGAANYPVQLGEWTYVYPSTGVSTEILDTTIANLTIGAGAGLVVHGASAIKAGDYYQQIELTMNGAGTIAAGGSLELLASDSGPEIPVRSGQSTQGGFATLDGSGTLTNSGSFSSASTATPDVATNGPYRNQLAVGFVNAPAASATVESGYLDAGGGQALTNQGQWTVAAGATMSIIHNNLLTGPTTFTNQGSYADQGTTIVGGVTPSSQGTPDVFAQDGTESGNPVDLRVASELNDTAGAGSFMLDDQEATLAGTIPAGQTVTIEGDPYNSNAYQEDVTLKGSQVVNQGTLIFKVPAGASSDTTDLNADTELDGSALVNQGTIELQSAEPNLIHQIQTPVTNQHGGTIDAQSGTTWLTNGQTVVNDGTLQLAPGANVSVLANPFLTGNETFVNAGDGTIVPQIASSGSGTLTLGHNATVTLGGTVAPQLIGGYTPATGAEIQAFPLDTDALTLTGRFAGVSGGFSADYGHETGGSSNYIGLVYGSRGSRLASHTPTVKHTRIELLLTCAPGSGCKRVTVTATATEKTGKRARQVVIARAAATLAGGAHRTVGLRLDRAGKALLARRRRLTVTVTVATAGKVQKRYTVRLSAPRGKKRRR